MRYRRQINTYRIMARVTSLIAALVLITGFVLFLVNWLIFDELLYYQKVVVALKETIRLMKEIDTLIPSWPIE